VGRPPCLFIGQFSLSDAHKNNSAGSLVPLLFEWELCRANRYLRHGTIRGRGVHERAGCASNNNRGASPKGTSSSPSLFTWRTKLMKYQTLAQYEQDTDATPNIEGGCTIEAVYSYTSGREEALGLVTNNACGHEIELEVPTYTDTVTCPTCGIPFAQA
jgi:hypothetical protein